MRIPLLIFAGAVAIAACSDPTTVCPNDLRLSVAPVDTTIASGEQLTVRAIILGCGGRQFLTDSVTWTSSDATVAVAGSRTGVVIGVNPGVATIHVTGKKYGTIGDAHITVE